MENLGNEKPQTIQRTSHLWDFLQILLNDPTERYIQYIQWKDRYEGIFKIVDPTGLANLWGIKKNLPGMTYDKMSRSLRNYYKNNKLKKVPGQRQVYQFLFSAENPPLVHPQIGLFLEHTNRLKKEVLFRQGFDLIPHNFQKTPKIPKKKLEINPKLTKVLANLSQTREQQQQLEITPSFTTPSSVSVGAQAKGETNASFVQPPVKVPLPMDHVDVKEEVYD